MMLKIATWNLELTETVSQRKEQALLEHIAKQEANIWVFTEAQDAFTKKLPFKYKHSSLEGCDEDKKDGRCWVTICSQYPFELLPTKDDRRTAAVRVHPENEASFVVFGTVLPWHGDKWQGHVSAGGGAFKAALDMQAGDWKCLREKYPDDEFFVAGDFNQDLVSSPPRYYGSAKNRAVLETTLESAKLKALTSGKFDPVRFKSNSSACIDHICCRIDSRWKFVKTLRWPDEDEPVKWLSDHFGIAVVLADENEAHEMLKSARGMVRGMDTTIESEPDRTF